MRVEIERLAVRLVERDADIARALYDILWADDRNAAPLVAALERGLGIEKESDDGSRAIENSDDDGIPDCPRRPPKAVAS
jgi:hypothetical protein